MKVEKEEEEEEETLSASSRPLAVGVQLACGYPFKMSSSLGDVNDTFTLMWFENLIIRSTMHVMEDERTTLCT